MRSCEKQELQLGDADELASDALSVHKVFPFHEWSFLYSSAGAWRSKQVSQTNKVKPCSPDESKTSILLTMEKCSSGIGTA